MNAAPRGTSDIRLYRKIWKSTFLATFIRRIPVIVKILPIAERGQYERLAFIHHFFVARRSMYARFVAG